MKKLINHPTTVVREMLEGAVALAPGQRLLADENVVVQADLPAPEFSPFASHHMKRPAAAVNRRGLAGAEGGAAGRRCRGRSAGGGRLSGQAG